MRCPACHKPTVYYTVQGIAFEACDTCNRETRIPTRVAPPLVTKHGGRPTGPQQPLPDVGKYSGLSSVGKPDP
jgi:hypothetical protein